VQTVTRGNIWIVPVGDMTRARQVNLGSITPYSPTFTPDGKLVYARESDNSVDIYLVEPSGENPKRLTSNSANDLPRVSPDGRYIVYSSLQSGTPSIWRMNIDGSDPRQLTTESSSEPRISPDGREVIYTVGVDTTKIWKIGIDGGQPVQLTDKESRSPVFSPDGKQFACLWFDEPNSPPKIAIIPATGGNPVKTFPMPGFELRWMPDGRSIAYILRKDGVDNIWSQPLDGGKPKQITNFTSEFMQFFDFSPDGKQIVVTRGTETRDVVLISGIRK
jgi:TolB protein